MLLEEAERVREDGDGRDAPSISGIDGRLRVELLATVKIRLMSMKDVKQNISIRRRSP